VIRKGFFCPAGQLKTARQFIMSSTRISDKKRIFCPAGTALVRLSDDTIRPAEIHWYEASGIGRKRMKIKRFLD